MICKVEGSKFLILEVLVTILVNLAFLETFLLLIATSISTLTIDNLNLREKLFWIDLY